MAKVGFNLNGKRVEVEAGTTILEAAQQNGVEIPTLCHDLRLKPTAACRLCLVEVTGARGNMPACATPVTEGMVVKTLTDDLIKSRRMALELLLSDHYGDCIAPCKRACPAGIDIQGYIALIANGQYREALKLIKKSNPLPLVCGRVCPRFCETECRRNLLDGPVAINAMKRFTADYDMSHGEPYVPEVKPASGHKIAIVGGGPAGLSAAFYLALEGHEITIFDSNPELGGMLRYGIPEYRLPKAILDREINSITGLCHRVYCNTALGRDFSIQSLKEDGYEAIFIALGAQANQKMKVEGEDLPGVLSGIRFLRDVTLGEKVELGEKVAVIGGGNTAIDAARTALRLGAGEVTILYRRTRNEMPANDEEVEQAEQEGIQFHFLAAPLKLGSQNGKVDTIRCIRMVLGEPDSSGRRRPEPVDGSEFILKVDSVITAIGQTIDATGLTDNGQVKLSRGGYIKIDEETAETSLEGVFAGGDCTTGPATVVEAIGAGRRAAVSINQFLNGQPITLPLKPYNCSKGELKEIDITDYENIARVPRTEMPALTPEERKRSFAEIELGLSEEKARIEAGRCLACGCQAVFDCKLRKLATEYKVDDTRYAGSKHHLRIKESDHPYILRDPNKCVLCGRCVRICSEVQGIGAVGFANRGFDTLVEPALGMPLSETTCNSCGDCLSTCPTGALAPKTPMTKSGPWELEKVPTVCPYCGIGCSLELNIIADKVVKVTSPIIGSLNNGNLCKRGSFNPVYINNLKRLQKPLIKRNGNLTETTWEEAITTAGEGLKRIREFGGSNRIAVLSSPQVTNEENYLVQKLARAALGTNNIGSLALPIENDSLFQSFGTNASTCSFNDILSSDLIMVYGCDIAEDYPIIALKVREAVTKGSNLLILNPRATRLDPIAKMTLRVNMRNGVDLLQAMLGYIVFYDIIDKDFVRSRTSGFQDFAREMKKHPLEEVADMLWVKPSKIIDAIHHYVRARKPVIVVNMNKITPTELTLICDLALASGNVGSDGSGIIALRTPGNAQGLIDMGVTSGYLPGHEPISDIAARQRFEANWGRPVPPEDGINSTGIIQGVEKGEIQGILVVGRDATGEIDDAIFEVPIFSVLIDTIYPQKPPYPDVILPGSNFAEGNGSYTNCERRIQHIHRAISPPAGKENWEIISALAASLGYKSDYLAVSSIQEEISELVPAYKMARIDELPSGGAQWSFLKNGEFHFNDGLARFCLPGLKGDETGEVLNSLT